MEKLLSLQEVAEVLNVPVGTLYKWRYEGVGPKGFRVGRGIRYEPADVRAWIAERREVSA
ncbi:MAG: helix-turn-helix transcriptional regulator [Actinomycetota bacterium]